MAGIEVGSKRIVIDGGSALVFTPDALPHDLLLRIAQGAPLVHVDSGAAQLRAPEELYARAVAEAVAELAIDDAEPTGVAFPGWWSPATEQRVRDALNESGVDVQLVNDAEAAVAATLLRDQVASPEGAVAGTVDSADNSAINGAVAVVNLRSGFTSVVIVQSAAEHRTALRTPTMVIPEGGSRLDTLMLRHLTSLLADAGDEIDRNDPPTIVAAQEALTVCRSYREQLSTSTVAAIDIDLPGATQSIRFVRSDLERLAKPWVDRVISMVDTVISESNAPVSAVLLTGGLAAMPLISQRVSADLAIEVSVASEPSGVAARGAAILVAQPQQARGWLARFFDRFKRHTSGSSRRDVTTGTDAAARPTARELRANTVDATPAAANSLIPAVKS